MPTSTNTQNCARLRVALILALVSLIAAVVLVLAPSRRASAQATASWSYTGSLNVGRWNHTATVLQDGRVLVAGGYSECCPPASFAGFLRSAELYDPSTGTWSVTGDLNIPHSRHTATLLLNGMVLVVGGGSNTRGVDKTAELYDPSTGTWSITGSLNESYFSDHTATLLPNGKVLVVGNSNTAELYDPSSATWSYTGNMNLNHNINSATLLPNGKVLVAGGATCSGPDGEDCVPHSPELYDPATGTWSIIGGSHFGSATARLLNTGKALFVETSELYDPTTGTWSVTGKANRTYPTATLLANGKVLVTGNYDGGGGYELPRVAELFDPSTGTWSITANLNTGRNLPTAIALPNGKVLVIGGFNYVDNPPGVMRNTLNSAELYDPGANETATPTPTPTATPSPTPTPTPTVTPTPTPTSTPATGPTWTITGNLNTGRDSQTATLLTNGKVLVVGGNTGNGTLKSAELYDPATGIWSNTSSLNTDRAFHTATLLPNGKVLAAGGFSCAPPPQTCADVSSAELYDPATGTWTSTGNLNTARSGQTATLLSSGKVLVAGGLLANSELNTAELYDPATGTWSVTGNLNVARIDHTSTLLPGGKVLVAGGANSDGSLNSAELYDPTAGTWSITGNLNTTRQLHTATLLPNGKVLVAAGFINFNTGPITNSAELYDPATGLWSNTGNLNQRRAFHTATLLDGGKVLVAGGFFVDNLPNITNTAELYDPATGTWGNTASLNNGRRFHTATLLLNGKVIVAGGSGFNATNTAELYDPGSEPVVLTADQVTLKSWTYQARTYAYVKLSFPNSGYSVADWGLTVRTGSDFSVNALVERSTGASVQAVTTTAQIYDLGPLADGPYNFNFKTSGTLATTLQFTVSSATPPPNTIDTAPEFVRQQYRDFLNREADPAGEDFWTDNITKCSDPARRPPGQTEAQCTLRQRETTSGAFFLSPEFQYTGYFVYRMYQGTLGRQPKLSEFIPDAQFVGAGIIVNGQLSGAKINQNKADFAAQFVNCTDATKSRCAEFKAIYDGLNNQQYVDKLFKTTGVTPTTSDRAALVNGLNAMPATETRASVLQKVVDGIFVISEGNQRFDTTYGLAFYNAESNRAFVLLEYFGYMKRDPDDAGYAFWLGKLNQFGGNFVNAEMVLAFISSPEYRARFGAP